MSNAINLVNDLEIKALWSYLDRLSKRVEVLEQENKEQWDFIMALSDDVARHNLTESDMHSLNRKLKEYMEFASEVDNE